MKEKYVTHNSSESLLDLYKNFVSMTNNLIYNGPLVRSFRLELKLRALASTEKIENKKELMYNLIDKNFRC